MDAKAKAIGATEECPVFEVVSPGFDGANSDGVQRRAIVEGLGRWRDGLQLIMVRNLAPTEFAPEFAFDGNGWPFFTTELRPLTRAAREMLALVEAE